MSFRLRFTKEAAHQIQGLSDRGDARRLKKVRKALAQLEIDPRYPALHSHKYHSVHGPEGQDVWDSYVENKTPSAWRIFWHYGPEDGMITVLTITPHP